MLEHRISHDLDAKLMSFGSLSDAQIALAFKLAADAWCPARPAETNVPAPVGRQTIRGTVVSIKDHEGNFGPSWKMTVKVTTATGTWLCWGTVPRSLMAEARERTYQTDAPSGSTVDIVKGAEVEFTATLKRGRDAHFALFSRPTGAQLVAA